MNRNDMDITIPCSHNGHKEQELAETLNGYLKNLIESGFFRDCDPRERVNFDWSNVETDDSIFSTGPIYSSTYSSDETALSEISESVSCQIAEDSSNLTEPSTSDYVDDSLATSSGFNYDSNSDCEPYKESLSSRFKRYIRRLIVRSRAS